MSFILKGELFTADANGSKITSITTDVLAIKPQDKVSPMPLSPIWSSTGTLVAYHRTQGLYLYDTQKKQETPILTLAKPVNPAQIPWRADAFTQNGSHLLYEDSSAKDGQTTAVYSLLEKKNVSLSDINDTILLHPGKNSILGFPPASANEPNLEIYSLSTWNMTTCSAADFRFIRPLIIPADGHPTLLSPDGVGLIGFSKSAGSVTTVKLMNLDSCDTYDVIKDMGITEILWLH
jgi:hypothetical protein